MPGRRFDQQMPASNRYLSRSTDGHSILRFGLTHVYSRLRSCEEKHARLDTRMSARPLLSSRLVSFVDGRWGALTQGPHGARARLMAEFRQRDGMWR
jgi:hypothetical protein